MVRRGVLLLTVLLLLPAQVQARERAETVTAKSYALIEADSGRLLMGEHEHDRLPMASTTKIMTAMIIIESGEALDTQITVPQEAAGVEGSSMHLSAGERISLRDLLYGLMMVSGNDAAVALAVHHAGSVEAFAVRMNEKAAALGCADTHFVNPNGLHDPDHYTSAYDLSCMAAAAMKLPVFRELVSRSRYTTSTGDRIRTFRTKNRMLTEVEGGCGVKTGFTKKAGRCLCFAAKRQGMLLVGSALNAPDMWNDAKKLLERGFSEYELHTFLNARETVGTVPITGSMKKSLPAAAKEGILYPVRKDGRDEVDLTFHLAQTLAAPVETGAAAGEAVLWINGEPVGKVPLIISEGAPPLTFDWFLKRVMRRYLTA